MTRTQAAPDQALHEDRDFTLRAVASGLAIGALLTLGNVYMGLKTGWWISGDITAAALGFALLAKGPLGRGPGYSIFENNITQTTAATATVMPSALGLLGAIPALGLMGHHYSLWVVGLFGVSVAVFGILLGLPLRQRYVVREPLPFPSAIATAEVMRAFHRSTEDARRRLTALAVGALVAAVITWFRDGKPAFIPGNIWLPVMLVGHSAQAFTLGINVSPALCSVGALVGARTGVSLALGATLAWGVLAPELVRAGAAKPEYTELVAWLLWPSVALMAASSLTTVAKQWRTLSRVLLRDEPPASIRGERRLWIGPAVAGLVVVLLAWALFRVHPLLGAVVVLGSSVLIAVCVRSVGETDIAPLGQLGQFVQLLVGLVVPGGAVANVISASVVAGGGAGSAVAANTYKAGSLVGAPPRGQLYAQLVGGAGGAVVALVAYALLRAAYGFGTQTLPVPGALAWKALAELSVTGAAALPPSASLACLIAAVLGVVLTLLEPTSAGRFLPSPITLAVAFIIPASIAFAMALGALAWWLFARRDGSKEHEEVMSAAAAGGIAGESLLGFGVAVLLALGAL